MRHYLIQTRKTYADDKITLYAVCSVANIIEAEKLALTTTDFTKNEKFGMFEIEKIKEISFIDFSILKNHILHIKAKPQRRNRIINRTITPSINIL